MTTTPDEIRTAAQQERQTLLEQVLALHMAKLEAEELRYQADLAHIEVVSAERELAACRAVRERHPCT